jgi:hypothetical protein
MMYYPYLLYRGKVRHRPVFPDLKGDPYMLDLSGASPLLKGIDARDQKKFQAVLDQQMQGRFQWGLSPYLELRDTLLADCPQMVAEQRFYHLGLDVIVGMGTSLHVPLDAIVQESGYESGEGNYGGYVLLKHSHPVFETFYSLYGHLNKERLPSPGRRFSAGDAFAKTGDFHENGNWFYHTHIQVITQRGVDQVYISKGYCAAADLANIHHFCPSPIPLFRMAD